ncbi:hypothetical protein B0T14DRAFT_429377, partial [Immersiella caudata]
VKLVELLLGDKEDVLTLYIYDVSLDDGPVYEALSYEWGENSGSIPVHYEPDDHLLVTPNLHSVLRRLREHDKPRTLWADASCMN